MNIFAWQLYRVTNISHFLFMLQINRVYILLHQNTVENISLQIFCHDKSRLQIYRVYYLPNSETRICFCKFPIIIRDIFIKNVKIRMLSELQIIIIIGNSQTHWSVRFSEMTCWQEQELVSTIATWLGWTNSSMNPVIYACCSRELRR